MHRAPRVASQDREPEAEALRELAAGVVEPAARAVERYDVPQAGPAGERRDGRRVVAGGDRADEGVGMPALRRRQVVAEASERLLEEGPVLLE